MTRQKRSCSAGTGGRGKEREQGLMALQPFTEARRHGIPSKPGKGGGGQGCGFRMEQKLSERSTGKELPPGRNPEHASPAEVRPDGSAAMHRDGVLQRNRDEDFAAKAAKTCPEKPKRPFFTGSGLPSGRRTPSMRFLPTQSRQKWRGTQFLAEPGKGSKGTIHRRNWEKGPRPMGAVKMRASGQGRSCSRLPATTAAK